MDPIQALQTWLASLGPYGYLVAAAVPVVVYLVRQKLGPAPKPVTPTPDPSPATVSPRLDAIAPVLNALLAALGIAPKGRPATVADVPHDLHVQMGAEWDKVNAEKAAAVARMARDYAAEATPAPTK